MFQDKSREGSGSACDWQRRRLLQGLAAAAGLAIVGGCSSPPRPTLPPGSTANPLPAVPAGQEFIVTVGDQLAAGSALAFQLPDKSPGIVFRTSEGDLGAISALCTHAQCTVQWQISHELLCPCHGSRFALDGSVLNGPAEAPLKLYQARQAGDEVYIRRI